MTAAKRKDHLSFRYEVLGYLLYCCYQLGFTGMLASELMLFIGQDVAGLDIFIS
jgi:hypothetical protein